MTGASALPGYRPCAGIVLAGPGGRVFVGRRAGAALAGPGLEAWQMPQGGIDAGETAEAAALRELEEEAGIPAALVSVEAVAPAPVAYDIPEDMRPARWRGRWRGQALTWVLMRYLGSDDQVDVATAHAEFSAWRWASPDAVVAGIVPFKRKAYEAAFAAFGERL